MSDYQSFKDQKFSFKKPWLFGEYETMQSTIDEAEIYLGSGLTTIESQFKKPYNKLDHPTSENFFEGPPGTGGLQPKINWGLPGNDCMPQGSAIGGGALNPCVPQLSCGQWSWTCAHRITKFLAIGGWIQSAQYGANDSVTVTVCWDESHGGATIVGTLVNTKDGAVFQSKVPLDCLGPGHDNNCTSCLDCFGPGHTPLINYSSKQMVVGGTQQFSAIGGGGGPYKWSLVSGGGSITPNGLYQAPATNVNCLNNPTIKVTDFCGNIATIKVAVSAAGFSPTLTAYVIGQLDFGSLPCPATCDTGNVLTPETQVSKTSFDCYSSFIVNAACCVCYCRNLSCGPTCFNAVSGGCAPCTVATCLAHDSQCAPGLTTDARSPASKTNGCCPAGLL